MAYKFEDWDVDPSLNSAPPPVGAPENATRNKQVNDIIRYVMAAVAEIGQLLGSVVYSLGSMASQNANAVNITGGSLFSVGIDTTNSINAGALNSGVLPDARFDATRGAPNSLKFNSMTAQQFYDFIFPIGEIRLTMQEYDFNNNNPPGVVATWTQISSLALIKISDNAGYTGNSGAPQISGSNTVNTATGGVHDHFGHTEDHQLTVAEMPTHTHSYFGAEQTGQGTGYAVGGTVQNSKAAFSAERGGDAGHQHGILEHPGHAHSVVLNPVHLDVLAWRRTA